MNNKNIFFLVVNFILLVLMIEEIVLDLVRSFKC